MTEPQETNGGNGGAKVLAFLDRNAILNAQDVNYEVLEIPEWGGTIRLRTLTGDQAAEFMDMKEDEKKDVMPRILSLAVVDANGDRVFEDTDFVAIMRKSMRPLLRVLKVVNRMNGFEKEDEAGKDSGTAKLAALPSA